MHTLTVKQKRDKRGFFFVFFLFYKNNTAYKQTNRRKDVATDTMPNNDGGKKKKFLKVNVQVRKSENKKLTSHKTGLSSGFMQSKIQVKLWSWGHWPTADEDVKSLKTCIFTRKHVKWALFLHVNTLTWLRCIMYSCSQQTIASPQHSPNPSH